MRIAGSTYFTTLAQVSKFNAQRATSGQAGSMADPSDSTADPFLPPSDQTSESNVISTGQLADTSGKKSNALVRNDSLKQPTIAAKKEEMSGSTQEPAALPFNPNRGSWINETA
jgi:hypothetical protein